MILDGIWDFAWCDNLDDGVKYDSVASVPGCYDAQGLRFTKRGYGFYRKTVCASGTLRLHIGSFGLHACVFWDATQIAESYFAWSPLEVEFEATAGEHELVIRVDNLVDAHPLFRENYDFYGFGGIYDHVTLENVCEDEVTSLQVLPLDYTTGEVELRIQCKAEKLTISFDGVEYCTIDNTPVFRANVPNFRLWSPETPNLHSVTVNEKTTTFGIRVIDWSGSRLLLNGKELKIHGLNRHESHPEFGAATPESLIMSDLLQIKKAGFNMIRGSHYPQRDFLFQICDKLGLMVWEESLSWGNKVEDLTNEVFLDTLKKQTRLMIRTSFNHPSLIIHAFLNECASDIEECEDVIRQMVELCHEEDSTRPATFATNRPMRDRCLEYSDLISMNVYPGWYGGAKLEEVPAIIEKYASDFFGTKPIMISEIGAAAVIGEHTGAPWSEEYQAEYISTILRTVEQDPRWSGVIFWLFCNANTYTGTAWMPSRPRGFNNKGLLDEYRRPKAAWPTVSKILNE